MLLYNGAFLFSLASILCCAAKTATSLQKNVTTYSIINDTRGKRCQIGFVGKDCNISIANSCFVDFHEQTATASDLCSGNGQCVFDATNLSNAASNNRDTNMELFRCNCSVGFAGQFCEHKRKSRLTAFLLALFFPYWGFGMTYLDYYVHGFVKFLLFSVVGCYVYCIVAVYIGGDNSTNTSQNSGAKLEENNCAHRDDNDNDFVGLKKQLTSGNNDENDNVIGSNTHAMSRRKFILALTRDRRCMVPVLLFYFGLFLWWIVDCARIASGAIATDAWGLSLI